MKRASGGESEGRQSCRAGWKRQSIHGAERRGGREAEQTSRKAKESSNRAAQAVERRRRRPGRDAIEGLIMSSASRHSIAQCGLVSRMRLNTTSRPERLTSYVVRRVYCTGFSTSHPLSPSSSPSASSSIRLTFRVVPGLTPVPALMPAPMPDAGLDCVTVFDGDAELAEPCLLGGNVGGATSRSPLPDDMSPDSDTSTRLCDDDREGVWCGSRGAGFAFLAAAAAAEARGAALERRGEAGGTGAGDEADECGAMSLYGSNCGRPVASTCFKAGFLAGRGGGAFDLLPADDEGEDDGCGREVREGRTGSGRVDADDAERESICCRADTRPGPTSTSAAASCPMDRGDVATVRVVADIAGSAAASMSAVRLRPEPRAGGGAEAMRLTSTHSGSGDGAKGLNGRFGFGACEVDDGCARDRAGSPSTRYSNADEPRKTAYRCPATICGGPSSQAVGLARWNRSQADLRRLSQ